MNPAQSFVHLHAHSDYSLLDGATKIPDMVKRAKKYGMPAMAITDHGSLFGAVEFYETCRKNDITPIIGMEAYVTRGPRAQRRRQDEIYHLILLALDRPGYHNLIKLSSLAYTEGFYYRPRIDRELLERYHGGLVALSSCLSGEVAKSLIDGRHDEARATAEWYRDVFGPENYYLEIQNHGLAHEELVVRENTRLAKETGIPLVATQDFHYLEREHAEAHDMLLAVGTGKRVDEPDRLRFDGDRFHLTSGEEMAQLFPGLDEALVNTRRIAERVDFELETAHRLPRFPLPENFERDDQYLKHIAWEGMQRRYGDVGEDLRKRFDYELEVITRLGFASYFLIVWDFIAFARQECIGVGPGRGSVAGSVIAYALGITDVDPIRFRLLFERFLNPERVTLPDIDLDFEDSRRGEVIEHVVRKYGKESVAQIITFGTMGAKAVIRDAARSLGMPFGEADRISKMIPEGPGVSLEKAISQSPDLKKLHEKSEDHAKLLRCARHLEGVNRHASVHAAGVLIAPGPLVDYLPLYRTNKGEIITQYDMRSCEKIGLLKMDFLGLRTMSVLDESVRLIEQTSGERIDLGALTLDDADTLALLGRAETVGVFQLESGGMRDLLSRLKPQNFEDISAVVALYRPGPLGSEMIPDFIDRRHGRKQTKYDLPELEPILRDTYGVIVYQEQVMQIAHQVAGFSLGKADVMRRAMSKKDIKVMTDMKSEFVQGATERGVPPAKARKLFDLVAHFAGYGFNKSHTVAYAMLAYRTAWLKTHHPAEFLAATLSSELDRTERIVILAAECRRLGMSLLPPDVNASDWRFTLEDGSIRYGLGAIKNVGHNTIDEVVLARSEGGAFHGLLDFCRRVGPQHMNRRSLEALVQAGALDSLGSTRAGMLAAATLVLERAQQMVREAESGQESLFGGNGGSQATEVTMVLPEVKGWSASETASREKEVLGFYLSEHPLASFSRELRHLTSAELVACAERADGSEVRAAGIITAIKKIPDRKGNTMAFITLEDESGTLECLVFSDLFASKGARIETDRLVWVKARVSRREGEAAKLVTSELLGWDEARAKAFALHLELEASGLKGEMGSRLDELLSAHSGPTPVYLHVLEDSGRRTVLRSRKYRVRACDEVTNALATVLGPGRARWAPRL
jgi:DNA polymerase-3 subunit alpha